MTQTYSEGSLNIEFLHRMALGRRARLPQQRQGIYYLRRSTVRAGNSGIKVFQ